MNSNPLLIRYGMYGLLCLSSLSAGCGGIRDPHHTERVELSGQIQIDGKPLLAGEIYLIPLADAPLPRCGTEVVSGQFAFLQPAGPVPGAYRVEIWPKHPAEPDPDDTAAVQAFLASSRQQNSSMPVVPPRYNKNSELSVTVHPGDNNKLELELTSRR